MSDWISDVCSSDLARVRFLRSTGAGRSHSQPAARPIAEWRTGRLSEIEFSRRVKMDENSAAPGRHRIAANEAERRLLAESFALPAIERRAGDSQRLLKGAGVRQPGRAAAAVPLERWGAGQP